MLRTRGVLLKMYAGQRDSRKCAAAYERMLVLAYLVAFRNVWVKIIFAVKLRVISKSSSCRLTNHKHLSNRLFVYDRQRTGVRHAYRANIFVRRVFVRVVAACTKHLGGRFEFGMDLQTNGNLIHIRRIPYPSFFLNAAITVSLRRLTSASSSTETTSTPAA